MHILLIFKTQLACFCLLSKMRQNIRQHKKAASTPNKTSHKSLMHLLFAMQNKITQQCSFNCS